MKSVAIIDNHLINYPTPVVGYANSFGSLSGICLVIQIITGVLLVAHYTPHISLAFWSIEHIMRDVNDGWLLRYMHSNGASIFFLCLYLHINQNIATEADDLIWISGVLLYLLTMATAFMGYILPWGQMSFWGATVITNLFAAIPLVGSDIAQWLWGGFSVANPTLNRFFSFHYLLPFIILGGVILHLSLLHSDESSNSDDDYIEFYYYYFVKDIFAISLLILIFIDIIFFNPAHLNHPDNSIMASISVTPAHLVPEWYFLPFYGVLRSTPDKFGGLVLMFGMIVDLFLIDTINSEDDLAFLEGRVEEKEEVWYNDDETSAMFMLFFLGGRDIEEPYTDIASILSLLQFLDYFDISEYDETEVVYYENED